MSLHAYIADISEPDQRAFRMGMLHLAVSLGRPLSPLLGAFLLETGFWNNLLGINSVFTVVSNVPSNCPLNITVFYETKYKEAWRSTWRVDRQYKSSPTFQHKFKSPNCACWEWPSVNLTGAVGALCARECHLLFFYYSIFILNLTYLEKKVFKFTPS